MAPVPTAQAAAELPPSGDEPFSIGNRVFLDNGADGAGGFNTAQRDNGIQDSTEPGVDGVRVELYFDVDDDNVAEASELARYDVTAGGGYYLFDDLPQGTYFVKVAASSFAVGQPLGGHHSSDFDGTEAIGAAGATADPATDLDDNGREPANRRPDIQGVTSSPITFVEGQPVVTGETDLSLESDPGAPANEVGSNDPTGWDGPGSIGRRTAGSQRDDASNVAVDFGFTPPMSIGNRIWLDDSSDPAQWASGGSRNNARIDATDDGNLTTGGLQNPGITGVDVQLYADENNSGVIDAGDILVATTTSGTNGYYLFDGLAAGNYLVRVPASEFAAGQPLNGLISGYDASTQAEPTNRTDSDDNGLDNALPGINGITSRQVRLIALSEATGETDPFPQNQAARGRFGEIDADSDLTIDFGFVRPPMSIGSQVWLDDHPTTQAQRNDGVRNAGEATIANVEVALYRDQNANDVVDAGEDTGLRDTTDSTGSYSFDNLPPGNYIVAVTAANFYGGGPLENMISSRSVAPNPLPSDNQTDDNDNGLDTFVAGIGIVSSRINLAYGAEPTTETGSLSAGSHGERNQDSDFSIDFGFYTPMSLGNRVWIDDSALPTATGTTRDNGELDPADDDLDNPNIAGVQALGVAGVTLRLYRDPNANGVIDAGEDTGRTVTTNAAGYYLFDGLPRGAYLVGVAANNFAAGSPLHGFLSSTNATAPTDNDVDSTDKGVGMVARPKRPDPTYGVLSPTITLDYTSATAGSEPTGEPDPTPQTQANRGSNGERDDFSNLTADFGFVYGAPRAANDSYSTPFGTLLSVPSPGVFTNDSDPENDDLIPQIVDGPLHGNLILEAEGSFYYEPDAGYSGPDSFTYRARNTSSMSSGIATVNLTVDANEAPSADDDSYTTPFETAKTVTAPGVLDGDDDPEGKSLTASVVAGPTKGTLTLNSNGSFTYTPDTDATGDDTFTYRVSDGYAFSDPATVTISIGADPNHPPAASDDSYTTPFQTPKTVTAPGVLTNDGDEDDDPITAVLVDDVEHGTLDLDADGSFTYTPDAGYDGPDSFTYQAKDARRLSNTATVELTVEPDTTPPEAELDAPAGPVNGPFDVEVEFTEPVTDLSEDDFEADNGTVSDFSGSGTSYELTLTPTASGPVTLDLPEDSADDAAGNGNLAATLSRVADLEAPSVDLSAPTGPVNDTFTVSIELSEPASSLTDDDLDVTGGTLSALTGSGTSYSVDVTPTADGPVTLDVVAGAVADAAGNTSAATSLTRTADLTAPGVELAAAPGPFNAPFTVTATFDESVTGLTEGDFDVTNGTAADVTGAGTDWSVTITPDDDGDVVVELPADVATDAAGNGNTEADPITRRYDATAPTVDLTAPAGPVNGPFDIEVEFSEPITGLVVGDFEVEGATPSGFTGSGDSYELTLTPTASGPVTLHLPEDAAVDAAGNGNVAATLSRVADLDAPTATLSTTAGDLTNAASVPVDIEFSEPVTGLDLSDLTVTGGTLSALTGSGASYAVLLTFDPAGAGATVGLPGGAATDQGGHPTAAATALTIAYDGAAPSLTIGRAPGQPDPVRVGRVVFVVTADEPVSDLAATSLFLSGAARAQSVSVERTTGRTFEVVATGMSARGDVELSVAAGAVRDPAGNRSAAVGPVGIAWSTTMPPTVELLPESRCLPGGSTGALVLRLKPDLPTTLKISSTDPDIVPPSRFAVTGRGDGGARALVTVRPPAGVSGTAVVTITATSVAGTARLTLGVGVGTNGRDRLVGTARPDLVFARGGADVVRGGGGSDIVCGGAGNDRLYGGPGRDALYGNAGDDLLDGPGADDLLVGGTGNDTIVDGRRRAG